MSISSYISLQSAIENLLSLLGKTQQKIPYVLQNSLNFMFKDDSGRIVGVDIRSKVPITMLHLMADKIIKSNVKIDKFVLITPYVPEAEEVEAYHKGYKNVASELKWMTVNEFAAELGLKKNFDLTSPEFMENLKAASVSASVMEFDTPGAPDAAGEAVKGKETSAEKANQLIDSIGRGEKKVPHELIQLTKKFPNEVLRSLNTSNLAPEEFFRIGESWKDAVIVLTDIKNFSKIVRAAYSADLNEAMFKYYRQSQKLIHEHGGILDKFIGDSVLAVFNYPLHDPTSYARAIKFAANMIQLGNEIFTALQQNIDEKIDTGTRVGVSTGEIWTLNIGVDEIDITFVGDKINLAARLEENCAVNGILISNITYKKLSELEDGLFASITPERKVLDRTQVKGQEVAITSWQISEEKALALLQGQT